MELTNQELKEICAGGFSFSILSLIGAGIVFIIGAIDGFLRPLKCN